MHAYVGDTRCEAQHLDNRIQSSAAPVQHQQ
jgi:hypothetical protein